MPPAVVREVGQAGGSAVGAVPDVVGFAGGGGLVAAAGVGAALVPQGGQAAEGDRDIVGLADVQRQRGAAEALAEEVAAQEGGDPAGAGDDLDDPGQDLLLQPGQRLGVRRPPGRVGGVGGAAGLVAVEEPAGPS